MFLVWSTIIMVQLVRCYSLQSNSCGFNSMCTCSPDQHDINLQSIHSISCLSVPFYKFPNPRVDHLPMLSTPFPPIAVLTFYLAVVFKLGPKFMKNRKPYKIHRIIRAYNLIQVIFNLAGFIAGMIWLPKVSIFCTPIDKSGSYESNVILYMHYGYVLLKFLDLLDTLFFILRKKYNQITFLHLYHHSMVSLTGWIALKFFPGGQLYFLGVPNTLVHVIMYFYYFLTSWDSKYKGSIWWKKHITQLQILQFCFIFISFLIPLLNVNCTYPKLLLAIYLPQMTLMIFLFSDFYYKTYIKKNREY